MKGSGTLNGLTVGNAAATAVTLTTVTANSVLTIGNAANTLTGGAADSVVHLTGSGTVALAASANYLGRWSVDSGTNQILDPGALGTGAAYNINAGAAFDTSPLGAVTYALTTKSLSANGIGTGTTASTIKADAAGVVDLLSRPINLTYTPTTFSGDALHPVLYISQGTLSCNGNTLTVNNASGTPWGRAPIFWSSRPRVTLFPAVASSRLSRAVVWARDSLRKRLPPAVI